MLQKYQNKIIKMILNVPVRTPTVDIHNEADIELVDDHIQRLSSSFLEKCGTNIKPDIIALVRE